MKVACLQYAMPGLRQEDRLAALETGLVHAREAVTEGAQMVCFPELFLHAGLEAGRWKEHAELRDGSCWSRLAVFSAANGCLVFASLLLRNDDEVFNAAVLFDEGRTSVFPKCRFTSPEIREGLAAGREPIVKESSVGRIGALTCFDLNFSELHRQLAVQRPQFIFFPTMFRGGLRLRALALETAAFVISCSVGESCIVDPLGVVRARWGARQEAAPCFPPYLLAELPLDFGVFHYDENSEKMRAAISNYPGRFLISHAQDEGIFLVESLGDAKVAELEREFSLTRSLDYFDATRKR